MPSLLTVWLGTWPNAIIQKNMEMNVFRFCMKTLLFWQSRVSWPYRCLARQSAPVCPGVLVWTWSGSAGHTGVYPGRVLLSVLVFWCGHGLGQLAIQVSSQAECSCLSRCFGVDMVWVSWPYRCLARQGAVCPGVLVWTWFGSAGHTGV